MKKLLPAVIMSLFMAFSTVMAAVSYAQEETAATSVKHKKHKGHIKGAKKLHHHRHHHHTAQTDKVKKTSGD